MAFEIFLSKPEKTYKFVFFFETNFTQSCSAHWERVFDEETLFHRTAIFDFDATFSQFSGERNLKVELLHRLDTLFVVLWVLCVLIWDSIVSAFCTGLAKSFNYFILFFWLRSVNWLIDFLRNSLDNRASFEIFEYSCCFAFSSFLHVFLRFARVLERHNNEALFYHTLKFGWGVRPYSDVFWAEETWLFLFRNLLFCSRYFIYCSRPKTASDGICNELSQGTFFTSNVFSLFRRNLLLKRKSFSQ